MNRIQNVFHHFSLVRVDDTNQIVGNHIGDPIQVQWMPDEPNQSKTRLFIPRLDVYMRTDPVLKVAAEGEFFQFDQQTDGSYVIHSESDDVNRLVLNNPAGPLTVEPAPLVGAPDFNKQFWRLVAPRPEFKIQNVLNGRFIAVIEDPANPDNCIVVSNDETDVVLIRVHEHGPSETLQCRINGTYYDRSRQNKVKCADNDEAVQVFQLDPQDNGSYVIHAINDDINRLVLNDANQVTNESAPPSDAPNFEKQFWRLIA
ncbi:hypothetical protein EV702DRAFT_1111187, partial [Suillus placidus]